MLVVYSILDSDTGKTPFFVHRPDHSSVFLRFPERDPVTPFRPYVSVTGPRIGVLDEEDEGRVFEEGWGLKEQTLIYTSRWFMSVITRPIQWWYPLISDQEIL